MTKFWYGLLLTIGIILIVSPFTYEIPFPQRLFFIFGIAIVSRVIVDALFRNGSPND